MTGCPFTTHTCSAARSSGRKLVRTDVMGRRTVFDTRTRRSIVLWLILAVGFTPALSSACAIRCTAGDAAAVHVHHGHAPTHDSAPAHDSTSTPDPTPARASAPATDSVTATACHGTAKSPVSPAPGGTPATGGSAAMDAMCAFAAAGAISTTVLHLATAVPPGPAAAAPAAGESFVHPPPVPPPRVVVSR